MEIASITQRDFAAVGRQEGETIQVHMKGDASGEVLGPLEKLLEEVHAAAVQRGVEEATVDIRELEFMSSSCFKCLVTWVTEIQSLDDDKQYRLRFVSNPNVGWQKRSLRSLHCFAVDLVKVDA